MEAIAKFPLEDTFYFENTFWPSCHLYILSLFLKLKQNSETCDKTVD